MLKRSKRAFCCSSIVVASRFRSEKGSGVERSRQQAAHHPVGHPVLCLVDKWGRWPLITWTSQSSPRPRIRDQGDVDSRRGKPPFTKCASPTSPNDACHPSCSPCRSPSPPFSLSHTRRKLLTRDARRFAAHFVTILQSSHAAGTFVKP